MDCGVPGQVPLNDSHRCGMWFMKPAVTRLLGTNRWAEKFDLKMAGVGYFIPRLLRMANARRVRR